MSTFLLLLTCLLSAGLTIGSEVAPPSTQAMNELVNRPEMPRDIVGGEPLPRVNGSILARRLAQATGTQSMSQDIRNALLAQHNHYRSLTTLGQTPNQPGASYMEEMVWDSTLAAMAMEQAKSCSRRTRGLSTKYAQRSGKSGYFRISQSRYRQWGRDAGSKRYVVSAVDSWYDTHADYNYETGTCQAGKYCGVYLNIIRGSTRFVGCGYNVCSSGETFVICNYLRGASSQGKPYPKVTASNKPCSGCPAERQTCSNFLCSGAPMGTPTIAPTGRPTPTDRPTYAPTITGQVPECRGLVHTVLLATKFGASTSGVTCQDYKSAFTSVFPCVQTYAGCNIADYPDPRYPQWAQIELNFRVSRSVWPDIEAQTWSGQVRAAMRSYLEGKGFVWGSR